MPIVKNDPLTLPVSKSAAAINESALNFLSLEQSAVRNIEQDYLLLKASAAGHFEQPVVRIWRNEKCLVVGKSVSRQDNFFNVQKHFREKGVPVIVRDTGGTIVPHGPGTLNVSIVRQMSVRERSLGAAYGFLCDGIIAALKELGIKASTGAVPNAYCDGDYNIVVGRKKLAGTAQRWKKAAYDRGMWCVLAHASIAVGQSIDELALVQAFYKKMDWRAHFSPAAHTSLEQEILTNFTALPSLMQCVEDKIKDTFTNIGYQIAAPC